MFKIEDGKNCGYRYPLFSDGSFSDNPFFQHLWIIPPNHSFNTHSILSTSLGCSKVKNFTPAFWFAYEMGIQTVLEFVCEGGERENEHIHFTSWSIPFPKELMRVHLQKFLCDSRNLQHENGICNMLSKKA